MSFLARHLQTITIALLALIGAAALVTKSLLIAVGGGIAAVLAYAWAAGRLSHLTASRFTADPERPWLKASPKLVDAPYALRFVKPGDGLLLRPSGAEPATHSILVSLMHGRYRAAAHLAIAEDCELARALQKGAFMAEVLECRKDEAGKPVLRIRIQASSQKDDALIA